MSLLTFGLGDIRFTFMKMLLLLVGFCLLCVLCWPIALLVLVLLPLVWLVLLPFRLLYTAVEAVLAFIRALLFLPARLLGSRKPARA
jgi:hypothetical protein